MDCARTHRLPCKLSRDVVKQIKCVCVCVCVYIYKCTTVKKRL